MSGHVPETAWFLFWIGLVVVVMSWAWFMAIIIHRHNMKALQVLRLYAERGEEPPPAIAEPLMRHLSHAAPPKRTERSRHRRGLAFCLFSAGAWAGVAWWRVDAGTEPRWIFYVAVAVALAFAGGALASLINALSTPADNG